MRKLILLGVLVIMFFETYSQDTLKQYLLPLPPGRVIDLSISYDGTHLAMTVVKQDSFFIYEYLRNKQGEWFDTRKVYSSIFKLQGPTFSPDNDRIYFSFSTSEGYDIAYVDRTMNGWTEPRFLDTTINSKVDEFSPQVDPTGKILYFSRDEGNNGACMHLFYSVWEHGHWAKAKRIVQPVNLGCETFPRMEVDGQKVFFISKREKYKSYDIYYTKKITQDIYTVPQRLSFSHPRFDEVSPTYDPVLKELIFVRREKRHDVLYAVKLGAQFLPSPVNILRGEVVDNATGRPIVAIVSLLNTITNSPITQFVTNTGHYQLIIPPGQNYTLKVTARGYSTKFYDWNTRKAVGNNIDNVDFKLFSEINLQLNIYDKRLYDNLNAQIDVFDSLKQKKLNNIQIKHLSKGKYLVKLPIGGFYSFHLSKDNYRPYAFGLDLRVPILYENFEKDIELNPRLERVVLKVVDASSQRGVTTEVDVVSKTTGAHYKAKVKTDANGNVVLFLKKGDVYEISITPKGYTFYSQELNLESDSTPPKQIVANVKPLKKNMSMQFHNITFELNSADLKEEAYPVLDQLVKFLKQNPNIKVEISAHTDDLGSKQYNMKLSLRLSLIHI